MKVRVLFFGATADTVGERQIEFTVNTGIKADEALDRILDQFPSLKESHKKSSLLFSINQEYSSGSELIRDGDELAIFTAVSGG